ncbi:hypothetical protein Pan44_49680 [Caulifigura coniformis]|uniref:Uncharacterized protein n=1 Tax=Caulifigura coniformis TaxID=2527983 RepID=A0A517SLB6_9PLAN|nr:hypothetical protein [Caulifigura coniformis]QDT56906.1 hypothetical protein Pan44_49680 [Caulifigura coniformis]
MRRHALHLLFLLQAGASIAQAEGPLNKRHFPVDVRRPGMAAQWNLAIDPTRQGQTQICEVALPGGGSAELYQPSGAISPLSGANRALLQVGGIYRFKISGLPDLPGIEVYPTVELIDHLHAPAGSEQDFPVPIEITPADVEAAAQNRLVTKVIYLEQPDLALPEPQENGLLTTDFSASANLMEVADQRGRPVAIIRIGGRTPDARNPDPAFFSTSGAVIVTEIPGKASTRNVTVAAPASPAAEKVTAATTLAQSPAATGGQPRPFPE